jgi:Holliday junction resolvasome RuvABC endonuclease subunit
MKYFPEPDCILNVFSLDPGTTNLGLANITYDLKTKSILSVWAHTLNSDKLPHFDEFDLENHTDRAERIYRLAMGAVKFMDLFSPHILVCEAPFFNRLRPGAYSALVECITTIRMCVNQVRPDIPFNMIEPTLIKKIVGANKVAKKDNIKDQVKEAVLSNLAISSTLNLDNRLYKTGQDLDEHSIDAIAIGYSFLKLHY